MSSELIRNYPATVFDLNNNENIPSRDYLYQYILDSKELVQLKNNPEALIATIDLFRSGQDEDYKSEIVEFKSQYSDLLGVFGETLPETIIQIAAYEDYGYSSILLASRYAKINPRFTFYCLINSNNLEEAELTEYLVKLSGVSNIVIVTGSSLSDCVEKISIEENNGKVDALIINHCNKFKEQDVCLVRLAESLGLIIPGTYVVRVNGNRSEEESKSDTYHMYTNGTPNYRKDFNDKYRYDDGYSTEVVHNIYNTSRYPGRWNMVYSPIAMKDCVKCTDFLDS